MTNPRTFFDLTVGDKPLGRVVFELFADVVPKTAENFRALCVGHQGPDGLQGYRGSPIHRVIDGFMIQGGDYTKRNGTGGASIYGGMFKDERLEGPGTEVDKEGLLVMANRGPDTNGSQYFVTLAPSPHLTGKHVVFGRVVSGMEHIKTIGKLDTDDRDRPLSPVIVAHCGELELRRRARTPSPTPSEDSEEEYRRRKRERRERKEREREERRRERKERRRDRSGDRSRSRSRSPSRRDKDDRDRSRDRSDRKERRKDRKERKSRRRRSDSRDSRDSRSRSPSETLSELDARLLREENERLEAERKAREEEKRARLEAERERAKASGGIVYKGRGTMRYRDPDAGWDTWGRPDNYNARGHDTRSRFRRREGGDRWERGMDVRADRFERERGERGDGDRDRFDRWDHGRRGDRSDRDRNHDDRDARERRDSDSGERKDLDKSLAERISLNYEEKPAEPAEGKEQRASAWNAARRASPEGERGRSRSRERSPSSDMVMDDDD